MPLPELAEPDVVPLPVLPLLDVPLPVVPEDPVDPVVPEEPVEPVVPDEPMPEVPEPVEPLPLPVVLGEVVVLDELLEPEPDVPEASSVFLPHAPSESNATSAMAAVGLSVMAFMDFPW